MPGADRSSARPPRESAFAPLSVRPLPGLCTIQWISVCATARESTMARKRISKEADRDGSMAFSEFSSTEPAVTRNFLEKVFGWRFESVKFPMAEYLSSRTPAGGQGGIRPTQAKESPGSTSYVRVDDLDAARKKIEREGREIVLPCVHVPVIGTFFWFRAPGDRIITPSA